MTSTRLSYETLREAVAGDGAALRSVVRLQPAAGEGALDA